MLDNWLVQLISGLHQNHILEPRCPFFSPKPRDSNGKRRSLNDNEKSQEFLDPEPALPSIGCRVTPYSLPSKFQIGLVHTFDEIRFMNVLQRDNMIF